MRDLKHSLNDVFELKGSLVTLTVLRLFKNDMTAFERKLEQVVQEAPNFFKNTPILIDVANCHDSLKNFIDFASIDRLLRQYGMIPVGVRGVDSVQSEAAVKAGFGILSPQRASPQKSPTKQGAKEPTAATQTHAATSTHTKLITQPVRSGQQVYAKNADLIIIAPVSAGAEILSDGNIHVYGPLRGRALAGIAGNTKARIFCQRLEAELISIAGNYRLNEGDALRNAHSPVQIYLHEGKLRFEPL